MTPSELHISDCFILCATHEKSDFGNVNSDCLNPTDMCKKKKERKKKKFVCGDDVAVFFLLLLLL